MCRYFIFLTKPFSPLKTFYRHEKVFKLIIRIYLSFVYISFLSPLNLFYLLVRIVKLTPPAVELARQNKELN